MTVQLLTNFRADFGVQIFVEKANQKLTKDTQLTFEILEVVKVKDDPNFNLSEELLLLEQIWIEKIQPFGERGYNTGNKIRQV